MKIAYATQNAENRKKFSDYISGWFARESISGEVRTFTSPGEMLDSIAVQRYDVVFLDMNYGERSGVEYVYRVRGFNPDIAVVILRFTPAGRVECIYAKPMMCVLEDFTERSFFPFLDQIAWHLSTNAECTLLLRTALDIWRGVPVTSVFFVESSGHKVYVHLTSGEVIETNGPIRELADRLSQYSEFLFPHRSFIVNAFYISCISVDRIYLRNSDSVIQIARGKLNAVKEAYDNYFHAYGRESNLRTGRLK